MKGSRNGGGVESKGRQIMEDVEWRVVTEGGKWRASNGKWVVMEDVELRVLEGGASNRGR